MTSWEQLGRAFNFDIDIPWAELSEDSRELIFLGAGRKTFTETVTWSDDDSASQGTRTQRRRWQGLIPLLRRRGKSGDGLAEWVEDLMSNQVCPDCNGARLREEALAITFNDKNIAEVTSLSIAAARIAAKVVRDRAMTDLATVHPGYGWERNAGYGTAEHRLALTLIGPTPHHRLSFKPLRTQHFVPR